MNPNSQITASILLVDDHLETLELLQTLFERKKFTVFAASCVADAKRILLSEDSIRLVLSDISMPQETGFDLLKWIKSSGDPNLSELPVILTTTVLPEAEHRIRGLQLGAVDYIVRPILLDELVLRVILAFEHFSQIKNLKKSLEDEKQLAQIGRVLAANSHEMKNLATIITMAAHMLQKGREPLSATDFDRALASITSSSEMLANMTKLGRVLLSDESLHIQRINIQSFVNECLQILSPKTKHVFVDTSQIDSDLCVEANETLCKQIIINFVLNSLDAIEDAQPAEGGCIVFMSAHQGRFASLCVQDNGMGLAQAGRKQSFAAFASTKTLRGGQGLGLWYCENAARKMFGSIELKSEGPGQGASAMLILPLCPS